MAQPLRFHVYRPLRERDDEEVELAREVAMRTAELLQQSAPDTFLGRKTQEPFPAQRKTKADSRLTDWEERFLQVLEQRHARLIRQT